MQITKKIIIIFFILNIIVAVTIYQKQNLTINKNLQMHFLNVGQGDATLVITPNNYTILIDGGPNATIIHEVGNILPNTKKIDWLILTHPHDDHLMGLLKLIDNYQIHRLSINPAYYHTQLYQEFMNKIIEQQLPLEFISCEKDYQLDNLTIDILYPCSPEIGAEYKNINNSSVILELIYHDNEILMMGDAEEELEEILMKNYPEKLKTDIIKLGHHGSKTSSSFKFLKQTNPDLAILSYGENNSFNHPDPQTLTNLEKLKINLLETKNGTISLEFP